MKKRSIAALSLAVILCACILIPSAAARWSNTNSISLGLSFGTGKTANCATTIAGMTGTTRIEGMLTLLKKSGTSWVYVDSLFSSRNTDTLDISFQHADCVSGSVYKIQVDSSVYRNGTWEDLTVYSNEKTCP